MKPALSIAVQTCRDRLPLAETQQRRILAQLVPGVEFVGLAVDANMEGPWASARRAWQMATGEHHLVVQEDAVLCQGFVGAAKMLLALRPGRVLSFYLATGATDLARQRKVHWVELRQILTGLAVAMPGELALEFVRWADEREPSEPGWGPHDDSRLQTFYRERGIRVLVPAPCLVQHDLSVRSTMGTGPKVGRNRREARWWIGDQSPFSVDWDLGFDQPVKG